MTHPGEQFYPEGVRWDDPIATGTLPDLLSTAAAGYGARPAIEFRDRPISYAELEGLVEVAASAFLRAGYGKNTSVALFLGNSPDHPVFLANAMDVKKAGKLFGFVVRRHRRRQSHAKPLGARKFDSPPGPMPRSRSAMGVVSFRGRTIKADLKGHTRARQGTKCLDPASEKQHAVGKDGNRRDRRAGRNNLADIGQHEGLAAGHKNLFNTERRRFARDSSHPLEAERAARRLGRGAHTAIIAT